MTKTTKTTKPRRTLPPLATRRYIGPFDTYSAQAERDRYSLLRKAGR